MNVFTICGHLWMQALYKKNYNYDTKGEARPASRSSKINALALIAQCGNGGTERSQLQLRSCRSQVGGSCVVTNGTDYSYRGVVTLLQFRSAYLRATTSKLKLLNVQSRRSRTGPVFVIVHTGMLGVRARPRKLPLHRAWRAERLPLALRSPHNAVQLHNLPQRGRGYQSYKSRSNGVFHPSLLPVNVLSMTTSLLHQSFFVV